jgi:integrase
MARPAKMWFRKQNKTWYVEIEGKQHNLGKDKKEAQKLFNKLMVERDENKPIQTQGLLAYDVACKFIVWCRNHRSERTTDSYKDHLIKFFDWLPNGKSMLASDLKPYHVIEYMDSKSWGDSSKRQAAGAVQRAFKWATSVGLLDVHPCCSIPKPKGTRREEAMTEEQFNALYSNSRPDFQDLLKFAWITGCRPQEIRLLRPEYVQGDLILFPVKESKGKRRSRVIYLNEEAKAIIERQPKNEWVFVNARGGQWTAYALNNRLDRLKEKLGFKCCLYQARHGFGTRKLLEGHSAHIVAALMGHSSPQMLEQHYGHVDKAVDHLRNAAR